MKIEKKRAAVLTKVRGKFGFVPNVFKKLALSPAVAETYLLGIEAQGVTRAELYEVIAITANKTIATYVNRIAGTGIDPEFSAGA